MQTIEKVKILFWLICDCLDEWKTEVWAKDLDDQICCDGQECGCGGATIGDIYSNVKPKAH